MEIYILFSSLTVKTAKLNLSYKSSLENNWLSPNQSKMITNLLAFLLNQVNSENHASIKFQ